VIHKDRKELEKGIDIYELVGDNLVTNIVDRDNYKNREDENKEAQ